MVDPLSSSRGSFEKNLRDFLDELAPSFIYSTEH